MPCSVISAVVLINLAYSERAYRSVILFPIDVNGIILVGREGLYCFSPASWSIQIEWPVFVVFIVMTNARFKVSVETVTLTMNLASLSQNDNIVTSTHYIDNFVVAISEPVFVFFHKLV